MSRAQRSARPARLALLGCGTVGLRVARLLIDRAESLGVEVVRVLVRDRARDRGLDPGLLTDRFEDILDARPDLAIEVLGGVDPAAGFVTALLERGVPVVTANKTLLAHRGRELEQASSATGAALACEAAVCAGVPLLASLRHLAGDRVRAIRGIVNGSCNYILSRMEEAGLTQARALAEAARRGLVEPDPSADLSGRDSAEKLCVLARAAGLADLDPSQVGCTGIEGVTPEDIRAAARDGRVIRLLAEIEPGRASVGPVLLQRDHPLAGVRREDNGVLIEAELAGSLFLRGPGAGPGPTASGVLGDVVRVLALPEHRPRSSSPSPEPVRRHLFRIHGGALSPTRVLGALHTRDLHPEQIELNPSVAVVQTGPSPADRVQACAADLGPDRLVLPVIE